MFEKRFLPVVGDVPCLTNECRIAPGRVEFISPDKSSDEVTDRSRLPGDTAVGLELDDGISGSVRQEKRVPAARVDMTNVDPSDS
jgi:hypothetical protein